ncbi:intraflagellar transport protein 46 homolog [Tubulanus polymorphus]|uniref:intraflagellar transport protein 46 homolog n=1 Tax=Tubulanus polymorphus TaxID=672921 RepID=UPI003DA1CD45
MDNNSDSEEDQTNARIHQNQPYDESLEVGDAEEVASTYTPTPRVPAAGAAGRSRGGATGDTPPQSKMSEQSDDDDIIESGLQQHQPGPEPRQKSAGRPGGQHKQQSASQFTDEDDDGTEEESSGEEDDDDDDDEDEHGVALEGAYDPADYENLPVSSEIKELFQYITRYTPQAIELEHKLKPFIPDFIPAVGDIDAFIKVPRPDSKPDTIGLTVLDEPCAKQSDPTVLDLKLRSISRQTNTSAVVVKSVENAEKTPKAIENWIESISEIHRSKPPPNVHYTKNMPDIDSLMQEWPAEFEELLKEVSLPTADLDCDLNTYVELICGILDIPIYKSNIQSLHVLFTLYSEFKNSQHFKQLADENQLDNMLKQRSPPEDSTNQLIL